MCMVCALGKSSRARQKLREKKLAKENDDRKERSFSVMCTFTTRLLTLFSLFFFPSLSFFPKNENFLKNDFFLVYGKESVCASEMKTFTGIVIA